jgi:lysophospholipase L1-like esterase
MERLGWSGAAVVAAAVAVLVLSAYVVTSWPPDPPASTARLAAGDPTSTPSPTVTDPTRLVVLGDSFSSSVGVGGARAPWPRQVGENLGWEVATVGSAGTGYVSDADGSAQRFSDILPRALDEDGDVIIVAGGVDDLGAHPMQQIVTGAEEVVTTLTEAADPRTRVVVVSPFSNGRPGPLTRELSTELRRIANQQGAAYVDATTWLVGEGLFADPTTPSARGQRRIANRMKRELVRLGIAEPTTEPAG